MELVAGDKDFEKLCNDWNVSEEDRQDPAKIQAILLQKIMEPIESWGAEKVSGYKAALDTYRDEMQKLLNDHKFDPVEREKRLKEVEEKFNAKCLAIREEIEDLKTSLMAWVKDLRSETQA